MTFAVLLQIGTTERGLPKSCRCWPEDVNLFDALLLVFCTTVESDPLQLQLWSSNVPLIRAACSTTESASDSHVREAHFMNSLVLFASHGSAVSVIQVCHVLCLISFSTELYYSKSGAAMLTTLYAFMTCHCEMTVTSRFCMTGRCDVCNHMCQYICHQVHWFHSTWILTDLC